MKRTLLLNFLIPVGLLIFGGLGTFLSYEVQLTLARQHVVSEALLQVQADGERLAMMMGHLWEKDDRDGVEIELRAAAVTPGFQRIFICDSANHRIFDTDMAPGDVPAAFLSMIDKARATGQSLVMTVRDKRGILGAFPVRTASRSGAAAPIDMVVTESDLTIAFHSAKTRALQGALVVGIIFAVLCASLWPILNLGLSARIIRLAAGKREMPFDRKEASSPGGGNELAGLSKAMIMGTETLRDRDQALVAALKEAADMKAGLDAHSIVAITDSAGKITYVNDKFCDISQFSREELLGQDHRIINSGYHPQSFFADLWKTIGRGEIWRGEIRNRAKGGGYYWVQTTIFPIVDAAGKPRQYIAIRTDVTARKDDEARLTQLAEELAAKNKELETIVYAISHDLRSPLLNVQGFGATLSNLCKDLKQKIAQGETSGVDVLLDVDLPRALHFIEAGIKRMDGLLNGFLQFSRLGHVPLRIEPLNMARLVTGCVHALNFQREQAEAVVNVESLPDCLGDATLVGQVFSNLIENALKYRDPARPCFLRISGKVEGPESLYTLSDNGLGIAAEHQTKIFELFHRLNPKHSQGEGLGLTISQRIVERLHGRIWLDSHPGKGTSFHVAFPSVRKGS